MCARTEFSLLNHSTGEQEGQRLSTSVQGQVQKITVEILTRSTRLCEEEADEERKGERKKKEDGEEEVERQRTRVSQC